MTPLMVSRTKPLNNFSGEVYLHVPTTIHALDKETILQPSELLQKNYMPTCSLWFYTLIDWSLRCLDAKVKGTYWCIVQQCNLNLWEAQSASPWVDVSKSDDFEKRLQFFLEIFFSEIDTKSWEKERFFLVEFNNP